MSDLPFDNWFPLTGVWGTDFNVETTTVDSGESALRMENTGIATKIEQSLIPLQAGIVGNGPPVKLFCVLQADANAGPDTFTVRIDWIAADRTTLIGSVFAAQNATVAVINTFESFSVTGVPPATTRYARVSVAKNLGFQVIVDRIIMDQTARFLLTTRTGAGNLVVAHNTWTLVDFGGTGGVSAGIGFDAATEEVIIRCAGFYTVNFSAIFSAPATGKRFWCRSIVNGAGTDHHGISIHSSVSGASVTTIASFTRRYAHGDRISFEVLQDLGAVTSENVSDNVDWTYLTVVQNR